MYFVTSKASHFLLILGEALLSYHYGGGKIRVEIETERLILRDLQIEDAPCIAERIAPINVSRYLAVVPHPYNLADANDFLNHVIKNQANEPREGFELAVTMKNGCIA